MAPYHEAMIQTLSAVMQVKPEQLTVKAKTNEKLGFVGSGDGVVCFAACTLDEPADSLNL
jgi:2C-methyl-D-erythritol 2,4-cyclodiphosphate synthase